MENYRALKKVTLDKLTPMTVLLGPNGSGKSTVFDVFNFLSECFQYGLRDAWDRRGTTGQSFRFIEFKKGVGKAVSGEAPDADDVRVESNLRSADLIAVNTLGQFSEHLRVAALREFITDWYVSCLSIDQTRNQPEAGPNERLSKNGENLPNVIQYLKEQHPDRLEKIFEILRRRIPRLERVDADPMPDGRLLLQIKDAPFEKPILSKFASDGTMKMLAYLTVLHDPEPPQFIDIEEPENFLYPRLLPELAEECRTTGLSWSWLTGMMTIVSG